MFVYPASVLQAMAVLVCAEMYQVKRLQHLCEVCVCAYLQSMPSRELASTGISVVRLLRRAKVSATLHTVKAIIITIMKPNKPFHLKSFKKIKVNREDEDERDEPCTALLHDTSIR